jgi:hypothetical protein
VPSPPHRPGGPEAMQAAPASTRKLGDEIGIKAQ